MSKTNSYRKILRSLKQITDSLEARSLRDPKHIFEYGPLIAKVDSLKRGMRILIAEEDGLISKSGIDAGASLALLAEQMIRTINAEIWRANARN